MFKLETMIYASEDGTSSVFTLNPAFQKQLDTLATQHPEMCQRKEKGEAGGVTYQVRGAALAWLSSLCWSPESDNQSAMVE